VSDRSGARKGVRQTTARAPWNKRTGMTPCVMPEKQNNQNDDINTLGLRSQSI
jgi:hypothetical protein